MDTPPLITHGNTLYGFNFTKFCFLAGEIIGIPESYRIVYITIFTAIALLIKFTNTVALIIAFKKRDVFFVWDKIFILSLTVHDLLYGCIVIPLFIAELANNSKEVNCGVSSWRAMLFGYFLSCRMLIIFFISFQNYIRTNYQNTLFEYLFENYIFLIHVLCVWTPGMVFILAVGFSEIKTDKFLGFVVFIVIILIIIGIFICYILVLKAVTKAQNRHKADIYDDVTQYVKNVLIWFSLTNIPLGVCGFVLLIYAFYPRQRKQDRLIVQQIYIAAFAINSFDAIINPSLFIQRQQDARGYFMSLIRKILFCFPIGTNSGEGEVTNNEESKALIKYSRVNSDMSDVATDITPAGECED